VFNRSYHLRAVRNAGGGHAAAQAFYRPARRVRPGKKPAASFEQLELFPSRPQIVPQIVGKSTPDPDRPLFDLFPEAYTENDAARPSQASQDERSPAST
jgi:hypothetical protein